MSLGGPSPSWFRRNFNEDYLMIYSGRDAAQAEAEVETITRELSVGQQDVVLDLCCGFGRHIAAFARRGIRTIGLDLSLPLLRKVAPGSPDAPKSVPQGDRRVICADMRSLPFAGGQSGTFSVVANFFTSFGYFGNDAENFQALQEIERVLRPGGRFSIDLLNAETTVANLEPRTEKDVGPFHLLEERSFDKARQRIEKKISLTLGDSQEMPEETRGETKHYYESVRIFPENEFRGLVERAGLRVSKILGDFTGVPFAEGTPRMIVLGEKP